MKLTIVNRIDFLTYREFNLLDLDKVALSLFKGF